MQVFTRIRASRFMKRLTIASRYDTQVFLTSIRDLSPECKEVPITRGCHFVVIHHNYRGDGTARPTRNSDVTVADTVGRQENEACKCGRGGERETTCCFTNEIKPGHALLRNITL